MKQAGRYLFLQGPHGHFFSELATALRLQGQFVLKVALNRGDEVEWRAAGPLERYTSDPDAWDGWVAHLMAEREISDLVLYGDARPRHAAAIRAAKARGVRVHCFEEGYIRPYWVTYERSGVNGYSRLMDLSVADMTAAMRGRDLELEEAPGHWGSAWHHVYFGFRYHTYVWLFNRGYPKTAPHRPTGISTEFRQYLRRMLALPHLLLKRAAREREVIEANPPYHLVLLQLAVDASMRAHSEYTSVADFMEDCARAFKAGAPPDDVLVFKAHPFEDGREKLNQVAKALEERHGLTGRIRFLEGGKLANLLDHAATVVTINSTAAQQALWRGLPVSVHGRAVFDKPELVSHQPLEEFFAAPKKPDHDAYMTYRRFLLSTSQFSGGFYTQSGVNEVVGVVPQYMVGFDDPYDKVLKAEPWSVPPTPPDGAPRRPSRAETLSRSDEKRARSAARG